MGIRTILVIISIFSTLRVFADCSDSDLDLLKERVKCGNGNSPANCENILNYDSAAGGLFLMGRLGKLNPKAQAFYEYFKNLRIVDIKLDSSYKKALEVFYELKKKSSLPNFEKPRGEFYYEDYLKLKSEMNADPRLKGNYFLEKFNDYGHGKSNDIFQRTVMYACEHSKESFRKIGIENPAEIVVKETMFHMVDSMGYSLGRMQKIYQTVSRESGYPENADVQMLSAKQDLVELAREKRIKQTRIMRDMNAAEAKSMKSFDVIGGAMAVSQITNTMATHYVVSHCAEKWGVPLQESEVMALTQSMDMRSGISSLGDCRKLGFTNSVAAILEKNLSAPMRSFMCKMVGKYNAEQEKQLSDGVIDQINNNPTCQNSWPVKTSMGNVTVEINSLSEWVYERFHASDDRLNNYMKDKFGPMADPHQFPLRLSPQNACPLETPQSYEAKAICDLSKELSTYGQLATAHKLMCAVPDDKSLAGKPGSSSRLQ